MKQNYAANPLLYLLILYLSLSAFSSNAQVKNDFDVRFQQNLRGDIILIGNNIVNRDSRNYDPEDPYNGSTANDDLNMQYIDIDGDSNTFSSSSAGLTISNNVGGCPKVVYAGLYWGAVFKESNRSGFNQVKLKTPGGSYVDITADEILFDGDGDSDFGAYEPYACYKDITGIITSLADPNGTYTVANVRASSGDDITGGVSGGWSIVVVYENPKEPGRKITTFDGYAGIKSGETLDNLDIQGFQTLPSPQPVRAKMGVMVLEGDRGISGDQLRIDAGNGFYNLSDAVNPSNNFFNGSISRGGALLTDRNPNSENTLGWDVDLLSINNSNNGVIPNGATSATLRAISTQDKYDIFFTSFDVEIIGPEIVLLKNVQDQSGTDIEGQDVHFGDLIDYVLTFRNDGNDDAVGYTIRDVLPTNVIFQSIDLSGIPGATYSYDANTRELIIQIPDQYVTKKQDGEEQGVEYDIRIDVQVVEDCSELRDACSNEIKNQAYSSYSGELNDAPVTDDPSYSDYVACDFPAPGSTNFLVDIDDCNKPNTVVLCGSSTELVAGSGFDTYQWQKDNGSGTYVDIAGANSQTYTVTTVGNYKVIKKNTGGTCLSFEEFFEVELFNSGLENPLLSYADDVVTCPDDGDDLVKLFLCGGNASRTINTNIVGAQSISWEKIDAGCENLDIHDTCANKNSTCQWHNVGSGSAFTVSEAGEYRLVAQFDGGCVDRFYFNVYTNPFDPTYVSRDIMCSQPGEIQVNDVPGNNTYEIRLLEDINGTYQPVQDWSFNQTFAIDHAGIYIVETRQYNVDNACVFTSQEIGIRERNFSGTASTTDADCEGKGDITVTINDVDPVYYFELWQGTTLIASAEGHTIAEKQHVFEDQNAGTYTVKAFTQKPSADGSTQEVNCYFEREVTIDPYDLDIEARLIENITCNDGLIEVSSSGGTGTHAYAILQYIPGTGATAPAVNYGDANNIPAGNYQQENEFTFQPGEQGTYIFVVVDGNNCSVSSQEITIEYASPIAWTWSKTDLSCFQSNDGSITVNHTTPTTPYILSYVLEKPDGTTVNSQTGEFTGLSAGVNYEVTVTQTYGDQTCTSSETVTITEPDRLTASAGVSKLPGCDSNDETLAEVRITNPLGGTPPYEYSFDGGTSYSNNPVGYLSADTHTLFIKDSRNCIFPMEIEIPDLPEAPTADVVYTYNCDGTGNIVLTPSIPEYEYTYDVNGTPSGTGSSLTVNDLADGEHTITIHYNNPNYVTYSNLLKEDFGAGANTTSPNIGSVYCYESQSMAAPNSCDPQGINNVQLNDGEYSVTSRIAYPHGTWRSPNDHAGQANGRFMAINVGDVAGPNGVIFTQSVQDVIPNQDIIISLNAFNLLRTGTSGADPYVVVQLVGSSGVIAETSTSEIPKNNNADDWHEYTVNLNPGNNTALDIVIRTQSTVISGNDIAIDDIHAYQVPEKCDLTVDIPVTINGKVFTAEPIDVSPVSCNGGNDGAIEFSISNFDAAQGFEYSIDGTTWYTATSSPVTINNSVTPITAGTYTVYVRDLRDTANCTAQFDVEVTAPEPVTVSAEVTQEMTCSNSYTAIITANAGGGIGNYEYQLEDTAGNPIAGYDYNNNGSNNVFTITGAANAGSYVVRAKDANDCAAPAAASVTIAAPEAIDFGLSATDCYNVGLNNGTITVTVTSGNGDYQFSLDGSTWFNPNTAAPDEYTFNNLTPDTYDVYVKDGYGCEATKQITINKQITASVTAQTNISCSGNTDGEATITVNDFQGSYSYTVAGGTPVTGQNSGTIALTALTSGTHTVVITDENSCSTTVTIDIEEPQAALNATLDVTPMSCSTPSGSVVITATAGWGGYQYTIAYPDGTTQGPQSTNTFNGLTQTGTYTVTVTDAGGCSVDRTFDLQPATSPALTLAGSGCYDGTDNVTITATATGGTAPYEYSINGGAFGTTNTFSVGAGTYTVTVRDDLDCTDTQQIIIDNELTIAAVAGIIPACGSPASTDITITAGGGDGSYVYSIDGTNFQAGNTFTVTTTGTYDVYVRDNNGNVEYCEATTQVVIGQDAPVDFTEAHTDVTCFGDTNGSITLTGSGGTAPYTYRIVNAIAGIDITNTTGGFGNLPAGTYNVTVTDNNGCPDTATITINQPGQLGADVSATAYTCSAESQITIANVTGGSGTYQYSIDGQTGWLPAGGTTATNYTFTPTFTNGTYTVRVRDFNTTTCSFDTPVIIDPLPVEPILSTSIIYSCDGSGNLTVTAVPAGTYEYQLEDTAGNPIAGYEYATQGNNNVFANVAVGNYVIRVNYGTGNAALGTTCTTTVPANVAAGFEFMASITASTHVSCHGGSDGSITFEVENFGAGGFEYDINGAGYVNTATTSPETITGLTAGDYTITVRDVDNPIAGCTVVLTQTITEPALLGVTAMLNSPLTCTTGASITASAYGGTAAYHYQLEDSNGIVAGYDFAANGTNTTFTNLPAETYNIRVRDANSCEALTAAPVVINAAVSPSVTLNATACYTGNNDGTITANVSGNNGNLMFRINGGAWITPTPATATTHTFTDLVNGSYTVEVRDAYGCVDSETININPEITATVAVDHLTSCSDGQITVTASGGIGTLQYAFVSTGTTVTVADFSTANTFTVTTGNDGIYDVYVWDNNANDPHCEYMETVTVNPATPLTITAVPADPECHDGTGQITITVTSGMAPYTYQIIDLDNGGAANETTNNVINNTKTYYNLAPGNYTINVTDATGCTVTDTPVTINNPEELTADVVGVTPSSCSGDPNLFGLRFENYPTTLGTIEFSIDGGNTWIGDNSNPGVTDQLTGYVSGTTVNPSMRTVDGSGNTVCQTDFPPFVIPYPLDDLDITIHAIVVNCNELQVSVQGSEGSPDYVYAYTDDPASFNPATATWTSPAQDEFTPYVFTGLVPGRTYVFYVQDAVGCVRQSNVNVNDLITVPLEITSTYTPSCFGANNGTITYTVTDNELPFGNEFRWEVFDMSSGTPVPVTNSGGNQPYASPQDITVTGLAPGNYFIQVTEVDGGIDSCVGATENLFLDELDDITGTPVAIRDITCDTPGLVQINNITGGGGTYHYTLTSPDFVAPISNTTDNPIEVPISQINTPNPSSITVTVSVEDQYGCPKNLGDVILNIAQPPVITSVDVDNCAVSHTVTINATASGGATLLYSIDNGVTYVDNGGVFTNVAAGTYDVSVIDSNGCTATSSVTVYPTLEASVLLTKLIDCSISPDAEITIEVLNGSGSYDYEITNGLGTVVLRQALPGNPFDAVITVPETYTVTIYDNNTTTPECKKEFTIEVPNRLEPVIAVNHSTDETCFGADNGTVSVSVPDNGTGPFTFEIVSAAGATNPITLPIAPTSSGATTATFTGLDGTGASGVTYTIQVTAANGCQDTETVTINEPAIIVPDVSVSQFGCATGNNVSNAVITIDPSATTGGSGTYTIFEFVEDVSGNTVQRGTNTSYTVTNLTGGSYTVNVYDDNNCVGSETVTIDPYNQINVSAIPTNPTCMPGNDGEVQIDVTFGLGLGSTNIRYDIVGLDVAYNDTFTANVATHTFTGLGIGTYQVTATNTTTGCLVQNTVELTDPNTFTISTNIINDVDCFGTSTGAVTFSIADAVYSGGFDYQVFEQLTNNPVTGLATHPDMGPTPVVNLPVGDYYVVISQSSAPACSKQQNFSISGPDSVLNATAQASPITCAGNDGIIEITASGGWGNYSYYVSATDIADPTDETLYTAGQARWEGLAPGTYYIYVMDGNGCYTSLGTELLEDPLPITADIIASNANCDGNNGEITVNNIAGGQGSNYTIQLIKDGVNLGAPKTGMSAVFTGLGAGDYTVTISDQWSCNENFNSPVTLYDVFTLSYNIDKQISCAAPVGGQITITATGGSGNFDYSIDYAAATQTGNVFTDLDAVRTYTFTVEDTTTGCIETIEADLEAPVVPVIDTIEATNVTCVGSDGTVTVTLDPATETDPPYVYELSQGGTPVQTNNDGIFTGLDAGTYDVSVSSALGCTVTGTATVGTDPTPQISLTVTDNCDITGGFDITVTLDQAGIPNADGSYSLVVNGATRNVTFDVSNQYLISGLAAGTYNIEIIDANGCSDNATDTTTITPLDFNAQVTALLDCETPPGGNAAITISNISGSGTYEYEINGPVNVVRTALPVTGITWNGADSVGDYVIIVYDMEGGCSITKTVTVAPALEPDFTATPVDALCNGGTGSIRVNAIDNGSGPFTFAITDATDSNGNPITTPIPADDTTPAYTATFSGLIAGTYTITATGANSCTTLQTVTVNEPAAITGLTLAAEEFVCTPGSNNNSIAKVTANGVSGGSGSYIYEFIYSNGNPADDKTQRSAANEFYVSNVLGGTVTVNVYDANADGCFVTDTINIDPFAGITDITATPVDPTCNGGDGEVEVTVTLDAPIGNAALQYNISNADGSYTDAVTLNNTDASPTDHTFSGLDFGHYIITVTNTNTGCELSTTTELKDPNTFDIEVVKHQDVLCHGTETGIVDINMIDASYSGGFTWEIFNAANDAPVKSGTEAAHTNINLFAGAYYVVVNQTGTPFCENRSYFSINQSATPMNIKVEASQYLTCTDPGEITVTATGGYGFYEYALVVQGTTPAPSDYGSANIFPNISAGSYEVFVRDAGGCIASDVITFVQPDPITATVSASDNFCFDDYAGTITVQNIQGGRPAVDSNASYLYTLSFTDASGNVLSQFPPQTSPVFEFLPTGYYTVTVSDGWGCDFISGRVFIDEPQEMDISLVITDRLTCAGNNAGLELRVTGGTAPYAYSTDRSGTFIPFSGNSATISGLGEGQYSYYVQDGNGCISQVSNTITIDPVPELKLDAEITTDVNCFGHATGYVRVKATGGLGRYMYSLYNSSDDQLVSPQAANYFEGLKAGDYYVVVESEDCQTRTDIQIKDGNELRLKTPVVQNPLCVDGYGAINVGLEGGTGVYKYAISPNLDQFFDEGDFTELLPGDYTVIAQDSKGCEPYVLDFRIEAPDPLVMATQAVVHESCSGENDGYIEINVSGGTAPYYTSLNSQDNNDFVQDQYIFNNLEGGKSHIIFVRDANGCEINLVVPVEAGPDLRAEIEVVEECVDNAAQNRVEVTLLNQSGITPDDVLYALNSADINQAVAFDYTDGQRGIIENVAPGADQYITLFYEACAKMIADDQRFTVHQIDQVTVVDASDPNIMNLIEVNASGGVPPYTYYFNDKNQGSDNTYYVSNTDPGYTDASGAEIKQIRVVVTDALGCSHEILAEKEFIDIDIPDHFTPNGDNYNDTWGPDNDEGFPEIRTRIYDRYGRMVAEVRVGEKWDGRYNGSPLPTGDYWYVMKLEGSDEREFMGHFTLLR
ncbi:T9SS type B sorting domain-containing protein [Zhouia spongiae]|uniref:T9SS type B sorting domain-containing protein n=1 Tax=Zhouia spongiae TaxID=2202721 RepID=A0ABY3YPF4_9FLAO|nr:T9SS type B sorting domain-containing protein [Zhouia spongiae]UNY99710.1 T9SS type B sorting domain-containing protein [Zhouia spongiae]